MSLENSVPVSELYIPWERRVIENYLFLKKFLPIIYKSDTGKNQDTT